MLIYGKQQKREGKGGKGKEGENWEGEAKGDMCSSICNNKDVQISLSSVHLENRMNRFPNRLTLFIVFNLNIENT